MNKDLIWVEKVVRDTALIIMNPVLNSSVIPHLLEGELRCIGNLIDGRADPPIACFYCSSDSVFILGSALVEVSLLTEADTRFFIVKSFNEENVIKCIEDVSPFH